TVGPSTSASVATVTVVPGSASLTTGDDAAFTAQLRDSVGNSLGNRSVSWFSTDTAVVKITSANGPSAFILARAPGLASLRATSEGKSGEASISVAAPAPVATVTIVPSTADLAVGDSAMFRADLRDAAGNLLSNRAVSWSASDSTIISLYGFGDQALVQPRAAGSVVLRATSEGKTGQAATALLSQYVAINTTNPPGNELKTAEWLKAVLAREGISAQIFEPKPGKANLYARLSGDGSARPLILLNHMDVVLASPEFWTV